MGLELCKGHISYIYIKICKINIVDFLQDGKLSLNIGFTSQNINPRYSKEIRQK